MRRLVAASALLAALAVPVVAPAQAAGPMQLPGTLVLTGTATGGVRVHIPRATSIDIAPKDDRNGKAVTISGKGRFVGAVIEQHAKRDKTYDPRDRSVYALRYSLCGTPTCTAPAYYFGVSIEPSHKFSNTPTLPAGDYDVFLVADGQPTTVTLRFKGLSGSRTVTPARSKNAVQWSPGVATEQIAAGHGSRTTSGDRGLVMTGPSAVVMADWEQSSNMERHATMCLQRDSAERGYMTPAQDCAAGLAEGRTVAGIDTSSGMHCIGLCTLGLEESPFAFGFMFFTEVPALPGARLLAESQAAGQFGYETSNVLVLPW